MARWMRQWAPETVSILASFVCLLGLSVLLAFYDGRVIFSWHGVTLNTLVSILATASKAMLMLAVAESVSQWKWILFAQDRRLLVDLERIESASRGPLGAVKLIWASNKLGFLWVGLLITLLAIAVDPFAQQLIQFEQQLVYHTNTDNTTNTIPRAERYARGNEHRAAVVYVPSLLDHSYKGQVVFPDADFSMQSAILYGLDQPSSSVVQQLQTACPSGNCTWDAFESLAICSKCNDLSSSLERFQGNMSLFVSLDSDNAAVSTAPTTGFRLPNGQWIDNYDGWTYGNVSMGAVLMTTFGTGNTSETSSMKDLDTLIWSMGVLKVPKPDDASVRWPDFPLVEARECALYYCVNKYESTIQSGKLKEKITPVSITRNPNSWQPLADSSIRELFDDAHLASLEFDRGYSYVARSDLQLASEAATYNVSQNTIDSISAYFQSFFADTSSISGPANASINGFLVNGTSMQFAPSMAQVLWNTADIPNMFETLATSMSNAVRAGADAGLAPPAGASGVLNTLYRVQWGWMALLVFLVLSGIVFLGFTIKESLGPMPLWKSSSLAIMSRGLVVGDCLGGAATTDEMAESASKTRVLLYREEELMGRGNPVMVGVDEFCMSDSPPIKPQPFMHI